MNALISNPADCEVRGVILFLQAENVRPCEIHQRLVAVYGEHVMNAASVRKWCIMFTNGRKDVHDAQKSGRSTRRMSGSVSCTCVPNCHLTFAIPQTG